MRVLLLEDNLIWSGRLLKTLRSEGHETRLVSRLPEIVNETDLAIVNLSSPKLSPFDAIGALRSEGIPVLGHAGHKEKELWRKGKEAGCVRIVSNSEITFKLPGILREMMNEG